MFEQLLAEVASATDLQEGPEGVRRILRLAGQQDRIGIRGLSRRARLPVPVVAAVRRELERRDILRRDGGIVLTPQGRSLLRASGLADSMSFACPHCAGRRVIATPTLAPVSRVLAEACRGRPDADVTLDQSHATAGTVLRRALYLHESDALLGRRILVLGDDDQLSLALGLLARHLGGTAEITVVDVDDRVLDHIGAVAGGEGLTAIVRRQLDLRYPLPAELSARFDVFATDPPYTAEGLRLFVSRGVQALAPGAGRQGFVSFAHRSPGEMLETWGDLTRMGLSISEVVPGFNRYEGAQILAGTSQMLQLTTVAQARPVWDGPCTAPIYTAAVSRATETGA